MIKRTGFFVLALILFLSCNQNGSNPSNQNGTITIFTINDIHGQLENFAKVKHIVDKEREKGQVLFVSAGDIFSGNPVVDFHDEKGYPIIDLMNRVGLDVSVLGNHEYDYGEEHLKNRIAQAEFDFICANVTTEGSMISQPDPYTIVEINDLRIAILGLVETNGSDNETIPSTHPWRVQNFNFTRPETVVNAYSDIKNSEDADLYIALTHIGHNGGDYALGDYQLAENFPYFDLIIGGHSHKKIDTMVNNIPIFQTGSYLHNLGKIEITVNNGQVESMDYTLIDLDAYTEFDQEIADLVKDYNDQPYLNEVVGYSHLDHPTSSVGCFYTDAMRAKMNVDISIQNSGGVRSGLNMGDITKREVYEISPFNNATIIYEMTVREIRTFLKETGSGFWYSGVRISQVGDDVVIKDESGSILPANTILKLGTNDYTPAVHSIYFPESGSIQDLNDAETLIAYLTEINDQVNYPSCSNFFRFNN